MLRAKSLLMIVSVAIVLVAVVLGFEWCYAQSTTKPSSQPASQPILPEWRIVIGRTEVDNDKGETVFTVTILNASQSDQVLYTPGFTGPILWPNFQGIPIEWHVAPRKGQESIKDFITLRPGEGFARSSVISAKQFESFSKVDAYLMIYKKGFEGHSDRVESVVRAKPLAISMTKE